MKARVYLANALRLFPGSVIYLALWGLTGLCWIVCKGFCVLEGAVAWAAEEFCKTMSLMSDLFAWIEGERDE